MVPIWLSRQCPSTVATLEALLQAHARDRLADRLAFDVRGFGKGPAGRGGDAPAVTIPLSLTAAARTRTAEGGSR